MYNNSDLILDRIKLKKSQVKWKILCFLSIFGLVCMLLSNKQSLNNNEYIARVTVSGEIHEDIKQERIIRKLAKNNEVKAVIIHINSPGGSQVASENLYYAIKDVANTKPLVSTLGTVAASGGYMVAIAAEQIFARPSTITGSIGVIMQVPQFYEIAEKLGVNILTLKSSELKAAPSPFEKTTPKVEEVTKNIINDNFELFVDMVSKARKINKKQMLTIADGRIYTGHQAKNFNLIDDFGGEIEAIKWLEQNKSVKTNLAVKDIDIYPKKGPLQELLEPLTKIFTIINPVELLTKLN